jgi:DNA-binding NtrC family response regulator
MKVRALLVDDETHRANSIAALLPQNVECVWAPNARIAAEQLRQEKFPIVMLDHDLYHDSGNGQDVAKIAAETQDPDKCQVFIHSQNGGGAEAMRFILWKFGVTVSPWDNSKATANGLKEWLAFKAKMENGNGL